jgi:hypothetical protein
VKQGKRAARAMEVEAEGERGGRPTGPAAAWWPVRILPGTAGGLTCHSRSPARRCDRDKAVWPCCSTNFSCIFKNASKNASYMCMAYPSSVGCPALQMDRTLGQLAWERCRSHGHVDVRITCPSWKFSLLHLTFNVCLSWGALVIHSALIKWPDEDDSYMDGGSKAGKTFHGLLELRFYLTSHFSSLFLLLSYGRGYGSWFRICMFFHVTCNGIHIQSSRISQYACTEEKHPIDYERVSYQRLSG